MYSQDLFDYTKEYVILNGKYVQLNLFNELVNKSKKEALVATDYVVNRKPNTVLVAAYTTLEGNYIAVVNLKSVTWTSNNNTVIFEFTNGNILTEQYTVSKVNDSIDTEDPLNGITQTKSKNVRILTWSMNFDDFKNMYPAEDIIK
ncbi:MAG TPA: hypothetical protein PKD00_01410 [Burkholderiales bacterium]|nr:hypothetical protein [Burkholderiales bacterium]